MRKAIVFGAAGCLGSRFCEETNLAIHKFDISADKNKSISKCDIRSPTEVIECVRAIDPEIIVNFTGLLHGDFSDLLNTNVTGTYNILKSVSEHNTDIEVILFGSAAEYGNPDNPDFGLSEVDKLNPVSDYGFSKKIQTQLFEYFATKNLKIKLLRIFNYYSENMNPNTVFGALYNQIEQFNNKQIDKITLGDLTAERDFIDVANLIKQINAVINFGNNGEIYNLGTGRSIQLLDIVKKILKEHSIPCDALTLNPDYNSKKSQGVNKIFANVNKLKKLA